METDWKRYLTDYNEGLGVVYERIVLNDYLMALQRKFRFQSVLEAPLYGMAGVSGINSVPLVQAGCLATLVDTSLERLDGVRRIWRELGVERLGHFVYHPGVTPLPFRANAFDLVWAWAALWYVADAAALLNEMARVSRRLVFIAMPNRLQPGYLLRKYFLDPGFFASVDESWANIARVKNVLRRAGLTIADEGVLDVPPWPDTVMPAAAVLGRLGVRSKRITGRFEGNAWQWSTVDYYRGARPDLKGIIERLTFLERLPVPWQLKSIWAHHRYVVALKP